MFERGTLWEKVTATSAVALRSGDLRPIPTEFQLVEDAGVQFLVRIVSSLLGKERLKTSKGTGLATQPNPFRPYDPPMYVADASDSHVCLLNKYNIVDHHLLIVTREFEDQLTPLTRSDFAALWSCMAEYEGLGFYNAGAVAGASQPHKHLQLVPLPLAPRGAAVPIEPLLESAVDEGAIGRSSMLPFAHAVARFDPGLMHSIEDVSETTLRLYRDMMRAVGLSPDPENSQPAGAYNLLVTRSWMLLVPRLRESFHSISLNAMAFAGALLVRDEQQMKTLEACGPMTALKHVGAHAPR